MLKVEFMQSLKMKKVKKWAFAAAVVTGCLFAGWSSTKSIVKTHGLHSNTGALEGLTEKQIEELFKPIDATDQKAMTRFSLMNVKIWNTSLQDEKRIEIEALTEVEILSLYHAPASDSHLTRKDLPSAIEGLMPLAHVLLKQEGKNSVEILLPRDLLIKRLPSDQVKAMRALHAYEVGNGPNGRITAEAKKACVAKEVSGVFDQLDKENNVACLRLLKGETVDVLGLSQKGVAEIKIARKGAMYKGFVRIEDLAPVPQVYPLGYRKMLEQRVWDSGKSGAPHPL